MGIGGTCMRTKPSRKQRLVDLISEKGILTETEAYRAFKCACREARKHLLQSMREHPETMFYQRKLDGEIMWTTETTAQDDPSWELVRPYQSPRRTG